MMVEVLVLVLLLFNALPHWKNSNTLWFQTAGQDSKRQGEMPARSAPCVIYFNS